MLCSCLVSLHRIAAFRLVPSRFASFRHRDGPCIEATLDATIPSTVTPPRLEAEEARIDEDTKSATRVNRRHLQADGTTLPCAVIDASSGRFRMRPERGRSRDRTIAPVARQHLSTRIVPAITGAAAKGLGGGVAALALTLALLSPRAALGGFSGVPTASAPVESAQTQPRDSDDGLAPTPLEAELLGFRMRVPVGTAVRVERGAPSSYLLNEESENPRWRVRATSLRASRLGTTARSQCEDYIAELRTRGQEFEVLANEERTIDGRAAHLFYLSVPLDEGGRGISGILMVPSGADDYLVFSILALGDGFDATRALLDRSFATIALVDRSKERDERAELLGRGEAIVASFTPERLRAAIARDALFFRMWRPDADGKPQEVGYVIIRVREGQRGEVDGSADPRALKDLEAEKGLLATVDARVIVNNDASHTLDVESRYFMTWDRLSESWSVRSTQRHRSATRSSAQTGIRTPTSAGSPRPVIRVISATRDGMTREPQDWAVPPAYLSQAELVVLGQLLPRNDSVQTIDFLDYAFDQRDERLPQRRETWSRTASGWRLETRVGSSPDKLVQEFDTDGVRVRRIDPDGTVTERITLEELRKLWRAKGLPVD
jgi:hypothetical protein